MLNELDFTLIGYCSKCGNPKYEHFEGNTYYSCLCKFEPLRVRKLKLVTTKENKQICNYTEDEEEKEIYGKTS